MNNSVKICSRCKIARSLTEFNFRNREKDKRHGYCKECGKILTRNHYERNKSQYFEKNLKTFHKRREFVRQIKNRPCADCGISYPYYVMDFDHREDEVKEFGLNAITQKSLTSLKREMAKCDVVCANCHRERTHQRRLKKIIEK